MFKLRFLDTLYVDGCGFIFDIKNVKLGYEECIVINCNVRKAIRLRKQSQFFGLNPVTI